MTREQIEIALDSNRLEVQWVTGRWHAVRRNGATKLWKRDPTRFMIPVKTGLRNAFRIATLREDFGPSGGHYPESPYLHIRENSI